MRTAALAGVLAIMTALSSSTAWAYTPRALMRLSGSAMDVQFGHSVSDAGDVNGDGFSDVIVGAPSPVGAAAGAAFVYYGGPGADAVADLNLTGSGSLDRFGFSVAGAGDVNGDGYADVIVGAPFNDAGGSDAGRAYVYYGGPSPDAVPDRTLTGAAANDQFGYSVSGAGDVNKDGYADVIVGAPFNDAAGSNAGRAYVHFGGPAPATPLVLTGATTNDNFATSVSGAGDFNKDGYADLIVGAPYNDVAGTDAGRAYVYYGGPSANAVADLELYFFNPGLHFGTSVSDAGDVNADGYADVIIGGPYETGNGAAFVYLGGTVGDFAWDLLLVGQEVGDRFGFSVSGAGDVNADGYADVVVGAIGAQQGVGQASVYYGGPVLDAIADLTVAGPEEMAIGDAKFGWSVSGAGDVDDDGHSDVIASAYEWAVFRGQALVFTSRAFELLTPNGAEQWVGGSEQEIRWLGANKADLWLSMDGGLTYSLLASDVGGLDRNEFSLPVPAVETSTAKVRVSVAGEALAHASTDASDGVFSIVEPHDPPAAAYRLQHTLAGAASEDNLGNSVSDAGDVNGDGYADVIVGSFGNDDGGAEAGRATVYYGGPPSDAVADITFYGQTAGDQFGVSVSAAGDVNGDGYADVIVGAWLNDAGGTDAGRAYVYYGGPAAGSFTELAGSETFGAFGFSVSGAGDVNGDGYADVIVGAMWQAGGGPSGKGRAYVYFGGPSMNSVADLTLNGEAVGDNFGVSVSGAGDVNGDGYADVIVGAWLNGAAGTNAGRAYVYYGGPSANAVADLVLTGAAANDNLGYSVSSAGDVNGDGYSDLVVGAPLHDSPGPDAGRAYVFFGGPGVDTVADLTLTAQAAVDQFGVSVSGAGDVNGDGYADVVVGAIGNDAGGQNAGRAYVYYGGPGADAVADHVMTGSLSTENFGGSVSGAGDVNGDGYSDLVIGAFGSDPQGALDAGRAYVYDSNRYFMTAPNGGETWNVGAKKTVSWLGAEPANVLLSVDGGQSYTPLTSGPVGGSASNSMTIQIPHTPTKFAKIRVVPNDSQIGGSDQSDSLFTIQTSVALLAMMAAPLPEGAKGATISWQTDPGPADLAGYRLERSSSAGGSDWRTVVALTRETSVTDADGGPGSKYRLFAVNGLGEELWLGEAAIRPLKPLSAWPLPYRGGPLTVSFATGGLGGGSGRTELSVYDVSGRLVRRIDSGVYPVGYRVATWDGRDEHARKVAPGVYFLHAKGDFGYRHSMKISVLR